MQEAHHQRKGDSMSGSWKVYVDTNLVGSGKISEAAIVGHDGVVWAASPGLHISSDEVAGFVKAFDDPSAARTQGLRLGGRKYFTLHATDSSIYLKSNADGVVAVKTGQAVVMGAYQAPIQAGEATPVVEQFGEYLRGSGY
ncbi:profilin [Streptomyces sp. NPDC054849]